LFADANFAGKTFSVVVNAEPVEHKNLPPDVQRSIDEYKDTEIEYYDDAPDWSDGDRAYFLVKNNAGVVVGYLVSDSWKSASLDVKIYFTLKFDSEGNFLESVSESFGYHE
jgi:hypothetical protein